MTGTAFGNHDLAWLTAHLPARAGAGAHLARTAPPARRRVEDVTSRFACFALWGPAAREILQPVTDTDLATRPSPT